MCIFSSATACLQYNKNNNFLPAHKSYTDVTSEWECHWKCVKDYFCNYWEWTDDTFSPVLGAPKFGCWLAVSILDWVISYQ